VSAIRDWRFCLGLSRNQWESMGRFFTSNSARPARPPKVRVWADSIDKVPAPRRKMGHVNVLASEEGDLLSCLNQLHRVIYGEASLSLEPPPVLNALNFLGERSSKLI